MNIYITNDSSEVTLNMNTEHGDNNKISLHSVETIELSEPKFVGKRIAVNYLTITDEDDNQVKITLFSNSPQGVKFSPQEIKNSLIKLKGEINA